jgi:hypothetical protein
MAGQLNPAAYRYEPALRPLQARDDFRLLTLDLDFPADPFARSGHPGPAEGRRRTRHRRGPRATTEEFYHTGVIATLPFPFKTLDAGA